jgi:glutathione synthase/RimK-type ligase-like ATP-grasp enzyme
MKKIWIIQDMRGWFWKTYPTPTRTQSLDVLKLKNDFEQAGIQVEVTQYDRFDFTRDYRGCFVLYGSAEDFLGGYKSYMEDVLLWLDFHGAILVPEFKYFRAHHNKVMMELLRKDFKNTDLQSVQSTILPSARSGKALLSDLPTPAVIKSAAGAGSTGVFLARNRAELESKMEKASRSIDGFPYAWIRAGNAINYLRRKAPLFINNSKLVVQNYIPNMQGDFKVLVFGGHYFVLYRLNRPNDFRASGSGQFVEKPDHELYPVLDFARTCKQEIDSPFASLDIGFDGVRYHLIEFQCVSFGFKAMSLSTSHFEDNQTHWQKVDGSVSPESEFSQATIQYLNKLV